MTRSDTREGRFRPRARLLTTLGAELISSEIVAIIELVRNCYDADAHDVCVRFEDITDPERARLTIIDDGHGMSRDILLGPWLEPATDFKSGSPSGLGGNTSPGGRRRLGSKGVGRFAAQRLGQRLELVTSRSSDKRLLVASFDWTDFEDGNRYLDELRVPWRHARKNGDGNGTELRITGLRDDWTPERLQRLKLGLSRLISPSFDRDSFVVRLIVDGEETRIRPAIEELQPMYSVRGRVDGEGNATIQWRDISGTEETWRRSVVWSSRNRPCGPFEFHFNAWDLDRQALEPFFEMTSHTQGIREFRRYLKDRSGISLYRDGFRILPYGEPDNDWLRLDRRRVNNPTMRLSNNQILGWIQLTADGNPGLKDQTNREGLVSNDEYEHLTQVVLELLQMLEAKRFAARRVWLSKGETGPDVPTLDAVRSEKIKEAVAGIGENGASTKAVTKLKKLLDERDREFRDTVRRYASLAAAGQLSGRVYDQMQLPLRQLIGDCDLVLGDLEAETLGPDDIVQLRETMEDIRTRVCTMQADMGRLSPLVSGRVDPMRGRFRLVDVVAEIVPAFQVEAERRGVLLHQELVREAAVHSSRVAASQALAAVLDNAIYWAAMKKRGGVATIRVDGTRIEVSNSGPPIDEDVAENIFKPHFSLRPEDEATGLGLTLAKEVLEAAGAAISLESTRPVRFALSFAGTR